MGPLLPLRWWNLNELQPRYRLNPLNNSRLKCKNILYEIGHICIIRCSVSQPLLVFLPSVIKVIIYLLPCITKSKIDIPICGVGGFSPVLDSCGRRVLTHGFCELWEIPSLLLKSLGPATSDCVFLKNVQNISHKWLILLCVSLPLSPS